MRRCPAAQPRPPARRCTSLPPSARVSTTNGVPASSDTAALPVVKIDNRSDPFATIVTVEFGDRLGELLDTVRGAARGRVGRPYAAEGVSQAQPRPL
jgi:hypothetical protein